MKDYFLNTKPTYKKLFLKMLAFLCSFFIYPKGYALSLKKYEDVLSACPPPPIQPLILYVFLNFYSKYLLLKKCDGEVFVTYNKIIQMIYRFYDNCKSIQRSAKNLTLEKVLNIRALLYKLNNTIDCKY